MSAHVVEVGFFLDCAPLDFLRWGLLFEPTVQFLLKTEVVKTVKFDEFSLVSVYVHF